MFTQKYFRWSPGTSSACQQLQKGAEAPVVQNAPWVRRCGARLGPQPEAGGDAAFTRAGGEAAQETRFRPSTKPSENLRCWV